MDKIALVTGATAGIGKACARLLAENGYHLIITGRRKQLLDEIARTVRGETGAQVLPLSFDIRQAGAVEESLGSLPGNWRNIDLLVNNAGGAHGLDPIHEGSLGDWEAMIDANVKGLLYVSRIVSGWMVQRGRGHIVNISSVAGREVYPGGNVYCATKHAVEALTMGMRIDLLQHGIRVTRVAPGMVQTEFSMVRFKGDEKRAAEVYEGLMPLQAGDIAEAVLWAAGRPAHVNINEILIMPAAQASVAYMHREHGQGGRSGRET